MVSQFYSVYKCKLIINNEKLLFLEEHLIFNAKMNACMIKNNIPFIYRNYNKIL